MNSARKQFVLLGLIAQGLAWEGYAFVIVYALAWFVLTRLPAGTVRLPRQAEGLLLLAGCGAGYLAGLLPQQSPHFFLGHGLAFLQLARLTRALTGRERAQSVMVAFLHLGVACTTVLDYRFLVLLLGALLLIPRVLTEEEAETFAHGPSAAARWRPSFAGYSVLVTVMVVLFIAFPRGLIGTPLQLRRAGAEGTLRDALLDPALSGLQQSSRVLMQIEGENVGHLRAMALVDFDGRAWRSETRPALASRFYQNRTPPEQMLARRVRVKDARFIDRLLPADGRVAHVRGRFFREPYRNAFGTVQTVSMWNTGNNLYEYWTETGPLPAERLPPHPGDARYRNAPRPSPRLRAWLDEQLAGVTEPYAQARRLEAHLRDHFAYTLGAPELNRLNALEDFLFRQREGHCERFASALALLLRMQGIPSRVIVGYVPGKPNRVTGWRNVRFRDAHAWTEAWFDGMGWVELDATPRGTMDLPDSYLADLLNALDVIWYLNIVNYDAPTQNEVFASVGRFLSAAGAEARRFGPPLAVLAGFAAVAVRLWRGGWRARWPGRHASHLSDAQLLAGHYYGELLRSLARQGFHRQPAQTPQEFLAAVSALKHPAAVEAALLTTFFCAHRYGGRTITPGEERSAAEALRRLKAAKPGARPRRGRRLIFERGGG